MNTFRHMTNEKVEKFIMVRKNSYMERWSRIGILVREEWQTTAFYLATLTLVFALGFIVRLLLT